MPLRRRRRLVRAAAVGGTAYAVGRHSGRKAEAQDAEAQDYQQAPDSYQQPPPQAAPPQQAAAPTSEADRVGALRDLKELLDSGAISQVEFENEKNRLLASGR